MYTTLERAREVSEVHPGDIHLRLFPRELLVASQPAHRHCQFLRKRDDHVPRKIFAARAGQPELSSPVAAYVVAPPAAAPAAPAPAQPPVP